MQHLLACFRDKSISMYSNMSLLNFLDWFQFFLKLIGLFYLTVARAHACAHTQTHKQQVGGRSLYGINSILKGAPICTNIAHKQHPKHPYHLLHKQNTVTLSECAESYSN